MELLLMKRWNLWPETQEESPTKTESEKQDFWKKLLDYIRNEYDSDIRTSTEIFPKLEKIEWCHGTCCNCSTCNYPNDECVCSHNRLITFLSSNWYL